MVFVTSLALGTKAERESSSPGQLLAALGTTMVVLQAFTSFLLDCPVPSVARQRCSKQQVPSWCDLDSLNVCGQSLLLRCVRLDSRQNPKVCEFIIWIDTVCTDCSQCRLLHRRDRCTKRALVASYWVLSSVTVMAILACGSRGSRSKREAPVLFEKDPSWHPRAASLLNCVSWYGDERGPMSYDRLMAGHFPSSILAGLNSWLRSELHPEETTYFPQLFTAYRSKAVVRSSRAWRGQSLFPWETFL